MFCVADPDNNTNVNSNFTDDQVINIMNTALEKSSKIIEEIVGLLNIDEFLELIEDEEETDFINADNNKLLYNILDKVEKDYKEHKSEIKKIRTCIEDLDNGKYMGKGRDLTYADLKKILLKLQRLLKNHLKHNNTYSFDKYTQRNKKIYLIKESKETKDKLISNLSFDSLSINYDPLNLLPPTFNIKYYNGIRKKLILIENATEKELTKELENSLCFLDNKKILDVIKHLIIYSDIKGDLNVAENINKKGFYILDDKVVENSDIKELKPTKEDIRKSIIILNNILEDSKAAAQNNAIVYKFMLSSPFNFCIKQLGKANNNIKGLILHGESNTGKSTTFKIGQWFYHSKIPKKPTTTETVPAYGRVLEIDSFPTLFDDSYNLLTAKGMNQTVKSSIIDIISRNVTDNETGGLSPFIAYSAPVFTFNEDYEVKDGSIRRLDIIYYNISMIMETDKFMDKYDPESPESPLKSLNPLGWAFKEKIIPLINDKSSRLNHVDTLTTELLKEIAEDVEVDLHPCLLKEIERDNSLDENIPLKLRTNLNQWLHKIFRQNRIIKANRHYERADFIDAAQKGLFEECIYYQTKKNCFVIHAENFKKLCSRLINKQLSFNQILEYLESDIKYEIKTVSAGKKRFKGFKISYIELSEKIFNIEVNKDEKEDIMSY